ncbi:hypothetical protein B0C18_004561 [Salmonella enterica]|nr:hypothetical protein [Salmonella enterica]
MLASVRHGENIASQEKVIARILFFGGDSGDSGDSGDTFYLYLIYKEFSCHFLLFFVATQVVASGDRWRHVKNHRVTERCGDLSPPVKSGGDRKNIKKSININAVSSVATVATIFDNNNV